MIFLTSDLMKPDRGQKHLLKAKKGMKEHCGKKKRDFRIIRSKVGGLVTRSVGVYKFFVWKCKILTMEFSKYQQYQQH